MFYILVFSSLGLEVGGKGAEKGKIVQLAHIIVESIIFSVAKMNNYTPDVQYAVWREGVNYKISKMTKKLVSN